MEIKQGGIFGVDKKNRANLNTDLHARLLSFKTTCSTKAK